MLAGPFTEADGETMNGSLIVIEAASLQAAEKIAAGDPFAKAGLFASVEIRPWLWTFNSPRPTRKSERNEMAYWLFKSEPDAWSWEQQKKEGAKGAEWDGVRNYQARNVMRAMKKGDLGFFYHSGEEKRIVGVVKVVAEAHPDSTDATGAWECVDVAAVSDVPRPVTLAEIKATQGDSRTWCWSRTHGSPCSPFPRSNGVLSAALLELKRKREAEAWGNLKHGGGSMQTVPDQLSRHRGRGDCSLPAGWGWYTIFGKAGMAGLGKTKAEWSLRPCPSSSPYSPIC